MFANFELFSGGWIASERKPRHRRSQGGCIPCRSRRKKCDEHHPVCGSCSARRATCNWRSSLSNLERNHSPKVTRTPSSSELAVPLSHNDIQQSSTISFGIGDISTLEGMSQEFSPLRCYSPFNISSVFNECSQGLPSCSLVGLLQVLDRAMSRLDLGQEFSILDQISGLLASSRSMLHAWLACSSIIVSHLQPTWRQHAHRQHANAVKELYSTTRNPGSLDQESDLAAILLLHVFERFEKCNKDSGSYFSATAPLCMSFKQPPRNSCQALMMETLIYHIAINSVFRPSYLRNYEDLADIIRLWSSAPALQSDASCGPSAKAGLSPWLPMDIFDIMFKAAYLLYQRHCLSPDDVQVRSRDLKVKLRHLQYKNLHHAEGISRSILWDPEQSERTGHPLGTTVRVEKDIVPDPRSFSLRVSHDTEIFHLQNLYILALELLITKIERPSLSVDDLLVAELSERALDYLHHIRPDFTSLLWPIAVLGTGMTSAKGRTLIVLHLEALRHFAGGRAIRSILQFLSHAWGPGILEHTMLQNGLLVRKQPLEEEFTSVSNKSPFGLNVLLEESLLKDVVL